MVKVIPKLTPINAIALVWFCLRAKLEGSAITVATIAPELYEARPRIIPQIESERAVIMLPRTNIANPPIVSGL